MTLPHTRHLDALVAKYVLKLEDVRLGWAFGSDAHPQWSSDRDYYGRDYIYRAREATETDAGYERVPDYASDGNAMLGLLRLLERQQTYIEDANSFQPTTVKLYSPAWHHLSWHRRRYQRQLAGRRSTCWSGTRMEGDQPRRPPRAATAGGCISGSN